MNKDLTIFLVSQWKIEFLQPSIFTISLKFYWNIVFSLLNLWVVVLLEGTCVSCISAHFVFMEGTQRFIYDQNHLITGSKNADTYVREGYSVFIYVEKQIWNLKVCLENVATYIKRMLLIIARFTHELAANIYKSYWSPIPSLSSW